MKRVVEDATSLIMVKREAYLVAKDRVKISHFTEQGFDINGIVHVGANDGYELQWYMAMGIPYLLAFEPLPSAYKKLLDYQNNAWLVNAALGKEDAIMTLNVTQGDGQGSTFYEFQENPWDYEIIEQINVPVLRYEDWIDEADLPHHPFDCLVVDTEGHELDVLQGVGDYLDDFHYLNIELRSKQFYKDCPTAQDVIDFLEAEGFTQDSPLQEADDVFFIRR